jgi:hypothetical protein
VRLCPGLGEVTAEYFAMLLGHPGVKADTMIRRFVSKALTRAGLPAVGRQEAHRLVKAAHEADGRGENLTRTDHAIWRFERARGSRG